MNGVMMIVDPPAVILENACKKVSCLFAVKVSGFN